MSKRSQRDLIYWNYYKANELKHLLMNSSVYMFNNIFKQQYYEHFIKYVLLIRLLTDKEIDNYKLTKASELINDFVMNFSDLYGENNLTYNLHAHLHLPLQVNRFGPLNRISCFPFEGFFKICKSMFYGTRGIAEQIIKNIIIRQSIFFLNTDYSESQNCPLECLMNKLNYKKRFINKNLLIFQNQ